MNKQSYHTHQTALLRRFRVGQRVRRRWTPRTGTIERLIPPCEFFPAARARVRYDSGRRRTVELRELEESE